MRFTYNVLRYVKVGLPVMQAWRRFRGLFKKKSCGASLCKSEEHTIKYKMYVTFKKVEEIGNFNAFEVSKIKAVRV